MQPISPLPFRDNEGVSWGLAKAKSKPEPSQDSVLARQCQDANRHGEVESGQRRSKGGKRREMQQQGPTDHCMQATIS